MGVRLLLHVPPGHTGKRAFLFSEPHCATGEGHSEVCGAIAIKASLDITCLPPNCPGQAPLVCSVSEDARLHAEACVASVGLYQETACESPGFARSVCE